MASPVNVYVIPRHGHWPGFSRPPPANHAGNADNHLLRKNRVPGYDALYDVLRDTPGNIKRGLRDSIHLLVV